MRYLFKWVLGIIVLIFIHSNALSAESLKIGILDVQRCFKESNEGKRLYEVLKKKQETLQNQFNEKENELKVLQKELEKQSLMLSLDAKEDRQREFERKRRELQFLYQDINEEMKKAEISAHQQVIDDLKTVVNTIAKAGKYELVLDSTRSNIVYWSGKADITDEVIAEYNRMKP